MDNTSLHRRWSGVRVAFHAIAWATKVSGSEKRRGALPFWGLDGSISAYTGDSWADYLDDHQKPANWIEITVSSSRPARGQDSSCDRVLTLRHCGGVVLS